MASGGSARDLKSGRAGEEIGQATGALERALDSILNGVVAAESPRERIKALEAEKKQLAADLALAEKPPEVIALHPAALDRYREQVENLHEALSADRLAGDQEPVRAFRELVDSVVVHRTEAGERLQIEVKGRLAALLGHDVFPQARMGGESW
jgi:site-specific DNA recombinase